MIERGADPSADAYVAGELRRSMEKMVQTLREGKLNISDGHLLFGLADPTGLLPEGVGLPSGRGKELARPVGAAAAGDGGGDLAHFLVYKPPGCHPGDVIKPRAATDAVVAAFKEQLSSVCAAHRLDLERCNGLFFSVRGRRSLADMIANSDLDGDVFTVIADPDVVHNFDASEPWVEPQLRSGAAPPPPPPPPPPAAASAEALERSLFELAIKT